MTAASRLAQEIQQDPRARLEAMRLEFKWKIEFYKKRIQQIETMIKILAEGLDGIDTKLREL